MELLFILQVVLAAVFAAAGWGKLRDLSGSRTALEAFGVPHPALATGAVVLPVAELAIALALLTPGSARWAALAALVLLAIFMAAIGRALSHGEAPDCHCFGQIHSAPAGRGTLVRNGALAVLAAVVAIEGPGSLADLPAGREPAVLVAIAGCVAAVASASFALRLWLDNRGLKRDLADARAQVAALPPGLAVGAPAPGFALPDLDAEVLTLATLCARGLPVLLVFATPDCGGCKALLPDLGRWQATLADRITLAVVSMGAPELNRPAFAVHGIDDVLLQDGATVMNDYRIRATPSAVVVAVDGSIASAPAEGAVTIEPLIRLTLRRQDQAHDTLTRVPVRTG
ncbi:MAG: TlpA family protein disulfide reductase [Solirubrobacteraceae bacterium]